MVFSSVPVYLDPPNWNQQPQLPAGGTGGADPHQFPQRSEGMMGVTPVRPASMADRARLAKVPQPEQALNCPRCDSTNTKFCYFNNYSLSQPRHFCKTCRRYWTRGGSLRNVPVGGGCRRNKRIKASGSSSKSQVSGATDGRQSGASSSSSTATAMAHTAAQHLPFMSSLHPLAVDYTTNNYIGLNFSGMHHIDTGDYPVGGGLSGGLEQWRLQPIQQFPFLGGLEAPAADPPLLHGLYPFDGEGVARVEGGGRFSGQVNPNPNSILTASSQGLISQLASVKMEDSSQGLNLSRQYLGIPRNDQYWGGGGGGGGGSGGGWMMDLTGFNSSSSGNLL